MPPLRDYPMVADPGPAHEEAMYRGLRRARELGLAVKTPCILWVSAPNAAQLGECVTHRNGPPRIFLRADLEPNDAYETLIHELQHVADARILGSLGAVAEERAEELVRRARTADALAGSRPVSGGHRQALLVEGQALAARAARAGRGFSVVERARSIAILRELDAMPPSITPMASPSTTCRVCRWPKPKWARCHCGSLGWGYDR